MAEANATRRLGIIGLGLIGSSIARRWLDRGWTVVGCEVDADRAAASAKAGVEIVTSPSDIATACQQILLSLPTSNVSARVVDELLPALAAGHTIIDTTTGKPAEMARLGKLLGERGVGYLDATIAGSSTHVMQGKALVLVGGEKATLVEVRETLAAFASEIVHVGVCGDGAKAKLVHNLVLGLNRAALAEGLSLAKAMKLDLERMLAVLQASPALSRLVQSKGPRMVHGDFEPEARLEQHLKDVRLMLEEGDTVGSRLPLSAIHAELLAEAVARGFGGLDNSAVVRVFEVDKISASKRAAGGDP
jgi:3-hydroxyisobutyrate dehydrogenase-like beta-hydroxyacid dehydrogenase